MSSIQKRFMSGVDKLNSLEEGAAYWMWMTHSGPEGSPFFVIVDTQADPDGARFSKRVQWVVGAASTPGFSAKGIVRRLSSGRLTFTTSGNLDAAGLIYTQICQRAQLPDLMVMQQVGQQIVASRMVENLSEPSAKLDAMSAGEKTWFCMVDGKATPRLLVGDDREDLKRRVGSKTPRESLIEGQIRRSRGGNLQLHVRQRNAKRFNRALKRWGQTEAAIWPALSSLPTTQIVTR